MLRMSPYRYHRPDTVARAIELMGEHAGSAMYVAGGTDLIPNMKHRLFEPDHLVALKGIDELKGIAVQDGMLRIGAAETLTSVARSAEVRSRFPALADAAGHVAGPQLRNMGTIGGNLCLDTRCTYYNQTEFWRGALGYCLKKDGDVCHVTKVGKKCVAAHSADTPPVLMTLGAVAVLEGPDGRREMPVADFFVADGITNTVRGPQELVTEIRIPLEAAGRKQAYEKLRQREAIDFPLLTVAVSAELEDDGTVRAIDAVVTALGSRPRALSGWARRRGGCEARRCPRRGAREPGPQAVPSAREHHRRSGVAPRHGAGLRPPRIGADSGSVRRLFWAGVGFVALSVALDRLANLVVRPRPRAPDRTIGRARRGRVPRLPDPFGCACAGGLGAAPARTDPSAGLPRRPRLGRQLRHHPAARRAAREDRLRGRAVRRAGPRPERGAAVRHRAPLSGRRHRRRAVDAESLPGPSARARGPLARRSGLRAAPSRTAHVRTRWS